MSIRLAELVAFLHAFYIEIPYWRQFDCPYTMAKPLHADPLTKGNFMPECSTMLRSHLHSSPSSRNTTSPRQRVRLWLCTLLLAFFVCLTLLAPEIAYARNAPHRRDRRPDREHRIRYPRAHLHNNEQSSGPTLHAITNP
jgi:hypothetical protein